MPFVRLSANTTAIGAAGKIIKEGDFYEKIFYKAKQALLLSLLSMVICVSMLVGSTFAWFTDSATANINAIKSGDLDVEIVKADGSELTGALKWVKAAGHENETIL